MIGKDKTRLILTIPKKRAKELQKLAKKKKCPVSEFIRKAIDSYILAESLSAPAIPSEEPLSANPPDIREFVSEGPSDEARQRAKAKKKTKKKAKKKAKKRG